MPPPKVEVPRPLEVASAYSWRFLTIVAAAAVVVFILVTLRLILMPVVVALLFATVLVPIASRIKNMGAPHLLATWATMVLAFGTLLIVSVLIIPSVVDQLGDVGRDARRGLDDVVSWLATGPVGLSRVALDRFVDDAAGQLRASSGSLISGAFRGIYLVVEVVAGILLTLILTFFFVKDGDRICRSLVDMFSPALREDLRAMGVRSWDVLTAYVRGTALVGLVDAVAIGIALLVMGVPLVLPLTALTFFGAFFPLVGALISGSLATLVALVTTGVVPALVVAAVTIVVQQVEGDVLQPLVLGKAVKLHPLVILLSLTAGAIVAGIAGAFLAVPLAAVIAAVASHMHENAT